MPSSGRWYGPVAGCPDGGLTFAVLSVNCPNSGSSMELDVIYPSKYSDVNLRRAAECPRGATQRSRDVTRATDLAIELLSALPPPLSVAGTFLNV
jgi:hypothetical protein